MFLESLMVCSLLDGGLGENNILHVRLSLVLSLRHWLTTGLMGGPRSIHVLQMGWKRDLDLATVPIVELDVLVLLHEVRLGFVGCGLQLTHFHFVLGLNTGGFIHRLVF